MEINKKELKKASYEVSCSNEELTVSATVTINNEGKINQIDQGNVSKDGAFVASFTDYSKLNIDYAYNLTYEEQVSILTAIRDFKESCNSI